MSRLTDYGIVLMTYVARAPEGRIHNVPELAHEAHLPLPTVGKVLKLLARNGLLQSHRGVKGGYQLTRQPDEITLADILTAVDGPIGITECSTSPVDQCDYSRRCPVRSNLQRVNRAVLSALETISLAEMLRPMAEDILLVDPQAFKRVRDGGAVQSFRAQLRIAPEAEVASITPRS